VITLNSLILALPALMSCLFAFQVQQIGAPAKCTLSNLVADSQVKPGFISGTQNDSTCGGLLPLEIPRILAMRLVLS